MKTERKPHRRTTAAPVATSPRRRKHTAQVLKSQRKPDDVERRNKALGAQLKKRRKALDMTQKELGAALGQKGRPVPFSTISRWEMGGAIEHPGMLFRALDALEHERAGLKTSAQ